ncbi:Nucleolar complex protein 2-like protein [Zea mays]|uniref:Nucleolar complex protein 2-like protein n=1 Tax=Zea mays TaxID=4577 RepID=A0A1D6L1V8_MAIZE|nr:Nucleolar complex protein 2-like protein [Zea mays]
MFLCFSELCVFFCHVFPENKFEADQNSDRACTLCLWTCVSRWRSIATLEMLGDLLKFILVWEIFYFVLWAT